MGIQMKEIAKQKDDGTFAHLGMREYCSTRFGIYNANADCIIYIVETYLECIDDIEFDTWLNGTHRNDRPIIFTRGDLETYFSDLINYSEDLECITDLFMYLYNQEFWIDKHNDCIYCTEYTLHNRKKLDFISIVMAYERLCNFHELQQLTWSDIADILATIKDSGYDIENDYDCYLTSSHQDENNIYQIANNIEERLQQVFSLY